MMSVCVCGVNLYDVKLCDVNLCDVNLCDVNLCDVKLCDVNLCDVNLCDVKLCDVNLCDVKLCGVNLCDVKLCDVNLCDFNLCDVNLCDVNLCDVKLCDVNLCDVNLCDVKLCDVSVRVCVMSICVVSVCVMSTCVMSICVISICVMSTCVMSICVMSSCVTSIFVMSICAMSSCVMSVCVCVMSICVVSVCGMSICVMPICVHSYPKRNLHTARRQTRMPARHPHKIFAPPIGTATPNAIYTQQGAKPACQQDIHTKLSHVLLAQLPRTQFTHSKAPNPHASKTSTQTFRMSTCVMSICVMSSCVTSIFVMSICAMSSYVMSVCVCVMSICVVSVCVMSTCVMSICVISICVMSACVMSICVMSSCVTSIFVMSICAMSSCVMSVCVCVMSICVVSVCVMSICVMPICVHSYPQRNLHTARRQTRMPARHPHKIFAPPIGTATPNAIYTQQGAKPACQQDIHTKFSQLLLAQLPRTHFTHSKAPNPHARKTSTQNFRTSYWHSYPERNLHTASRQTRMPGRHPHKIFAAPIGTATSNAIYTQRAAKTRMPAGHQRKIFAAPIGTATPNAIYTEHAAKPACQQDINAKFSQLLLAQLPRTHFTHSKPPNPHARKTSTQNFRISYCDSYPERNLHTSCRCSKSHACHAKATAERRRPKRAKAYIRPRAGAASPTPATQKQRQSGGDQNAPKRTSDPAQVLQVPRLPRKSSGRAAETKTRQSVHQTPCKCSKCHACHAKAAAERRRPKRAKAYIRPRAGAASPTPATQKQRQSSRDQNAPKRTSDPVQVLQVPRQPRKSSGRAAETKTRQSVHQTPRKCSKSHACHAKQRQSGGDQNAPKRTSDPVQVLQVPRLPHKSSGRAAETKTRQSVHQTPCKCSKRHACHAKAAAERRRPKRAKAYSRPRASAPSPTPATQKQRQSGGDQNAPKRTSDPVQVQQVPRLPHKSSGRAAETKTRQSVHQTPCKCSKPHACHAKAAAERRRPKRAKAYIRPRAGAASPTPATQKQRQSGGDQNAPKRTSDPAQVLQAPRLPRKSSGRAAETKTRQSVHQTPCKCSKRHACHAKAAAERRRPKRAKAYIRPRASAPSARPATQKQRQSGGDQNAPKRTSDPVQVLQAPRLPRKSNGKAAETKTRQSVHQTPCRCSKSHACHAKAAAERRRPKRAKAYIRPRASAPSPTPATQKQRQSGGDQNAPKRTSDPVQVLQVPRLPRKSSGRAKLCDVNLRDVKLCDVKLCDVKLCDINLCDVKL